MSRIVFLEPERIFVRSRAKNCCEYCKSQDRFSPIYFTIDHSLPICEGGTNELENLVYACNLCNRLKWNHIFVIDSVTNARVLVFNPRVHVWEEHFQWSEDYLMIIGLTAIGRATVDTLKLNRDKLVNYRLEMLEIGKHPIV
jgi:hypothetical protein